MRILPPDQIVLDHVAARETAIVGRAVDWANVSSGSRNASGLAHVLALLEAEARRLPAEVVRIPTRAMVIGVVPRGSSSALLWAAGRSEEHTSELQSQ